MGKRSGCVPLKELIAVLDSLEANEEVKESCIELFKQFPCVSGNEIRNDLVDLRRVRRVVELVDLLTILYQIETKNAQILEVKLREDLSPN